MSRGWQRKDNNRAVLTEIVDKRCALTTTNTPAHRQQSGVAKHYKPGVRVVNVPSDTYQHQTELESSADRRHTITRPTRAVLIATSLCIHRHLSSYNV